MSFNRYSKLGYDEGAFLIEVYEKVGTEPFLYRQIRNDANPRYLKTLRNKKFVRKVGRVRREGTTSYITKWELTEPAIRFVKEYARA